MQYNWQLIHHTIISVWNMMQKLGEIVSLLAITE